MISAACAVGCALVLVGLASVVEPGWWRRQRPTERAAKHAVEHAQNTGHGVWRAKDAPWRCQRGCKL